MPEISPGFTSPPVTTPTPTAEPLSTSPTLQRCANCDAVLTGHYCGNCGAPRADERPLTVRRFAHDLWDEVTNVDSTTVRTVQGLFRRPGLLTREYVAGRTRKYLPPLRVYLLAFGVMLFARTAMHADARYVAAVRERIEAKEASDPNLAAIRARRARTQRRMPDFVTPLTGAVQVALSNQWLHLIDPLSVALVLLLLHRVRRRSYAEHVVFALHLLAFNCILSVVTTALHMQFSRRITDTDAVSVIHWLAFAGYGYVAMRRVYGESRPRTAIKSVGLVAGAQAAMMVVPMVTGLVVTAWTIARLD